MANFCTNCGTKLEKDYKFCINCGTRIADLDTGENRPPLKSVPDSEEVKKAKKELKRVIGGRLTYNKNFLKALADNGIDTTHNRLAIRRQVNDEIESGQITSAGVEVRVYQVIAEYRILMEEENKRLKLIDEILESDEITSEIMKNKSNTTFTSTVKDNIKEKLTDEKEIRSEDEIRDFIKSELEKLKQEERKAKIQARQTPVSREIRTGSRKTESNGGYCDYSCRHYIEEFMDSDGQLSFDLSCDTVMFDYYCNLGHNVAHGSFCRYYER